MDLKNHSESSIGLCEIAFQLVWSDNRNENKRNQKYSGYRKGRGGQSGVGSTAIRKIEEDGSGVNYNRQILSTHFSMFLIFSKQ